MKTGDVEAIAGVKGERVKPGDRAAEEELGAQEKAGSQEPRQLNHQVSATAAAGCLLVWAWCDRKVSEGRNQLDFGMLSFLKLRYACHQGRGVLYSC